MLKLKDLYNNLSFDHVAQSEQGVCKLPELKLYVSNFEFASPLSRGHNCQWIIKSVKNRIVIPSVGFEHKDDEHQFDCLIGYCMYIIDYAKLITNHNGISLPNQFWQPYPK